MRVLNATQMREADRLTIEESGVPSIVLMENAGRQVVGALEARFEELVGQRVVVLCGCGNDGGDGFVIARALKQREIDAAVFLVGAVRDVQGDARCNLNILGQIGMPVVEIPDEQAWELHYSEIAGFDVIVDAILGTGIKVPWDSSHRRCRPGIRRGNRAVASLSGCNRHYVVAWSRRVSCCGTDGARHRRRTRFNVARGTRDRHGPSDGVSSWRFTVRCHDCGRHVVRAFSGRGCPIRLSVGRARDLGGGRPHRDDV